MTIDTASAQLELRIQGIRVKNGKLGILRIAIFSSQDGFPDDPKKALMQRSVDLDGRLYERESSEFKSKTESISSTELFTGLQPNQEYAVSVLHDANRNGVLDTGMFGIPTEGIGFSQNPSIWRGAPAFSKCTLKLQTGSNISPIEMVYLL
jgi:uncharacterized protein (DUF2141 family)